MSFSLFILQLTTQTYLKCLFWWHWVSADNRFVCTFLGGLLNQVYIITSEKHFSSVVLSDSKQVTVLNASYSRLFHEAVQLQVFNVTGANISAVFLLLLSCFTRSVFFLDWPLWALPVDVKETWKKKYIHLVIMMAGYKNCIHWASASTMLI